MDINELLRLHELATSTVARLAKHRLAFETLAKDAGPHFVGVIGPRGVGKTVLLRQWAAEHHDAFYLSADTLDRHEDDLFAIVQLLRDRYGYRTFLLDEVHFLPEVSGVLKRIYDFLEVRVIFTSSVALAMHESSHDLSRRVRLLSLPFFSYREFLWFRGQELLPKLDLNALLEQRWTPDHLRAGHRFDEYLRGGLLPFALDEPSPLPLLANIVDKVIAKDIPSVARLMVDELDTLRRLLRFVGRAAVDGINGTSLSHNLGVTKYKATHYLDCLEKAFILRQIAPTGTNVLREPKVLMTPPHRLLYRDYDDAVGGLREDYVAEALGQAGMPFHYLKGTRGTKTPDYAINHNGRLIVLEVGGRGKGREQFKGFQADQKIVLAHDGVPAEGRIPLFMLGYLA